MRLDRRWPIGLAAALLTLLATLTSPPALATDLCSSTGSSAGPFDLLAYEARDWQSLYSTTLSLAGGNNLFPGDPDFGLPQLETGPRSAGSSQLVPPYIPPVLLKAIAWIESGWTQATAAVPYGGTGPALISHDCGYGIMQVTSGMQNTTGTPSLQQAMIGGHYGFNVAAGARILADKWNLAPELRPLVGDRNPAIIENWYYAVWSYNGFAFQNHPLNPSYPSWPRVPYSCGPSGDGFGHDRSQYPYQELVFGCMAHPPQPGGVRLWTPQDVSLPQPASSVEVVKEGDLIYGSDGRVYVIQGGSKRWIVSAGVFQACGYRWENVRQVTDTTINTIPTGLDVIWCPPEGSLLYGSDGRIHVIRGGLKRYIPNPATFEVNGFSWAGAVQVADSLLAAIPDGHPLPDVLADGNLPFGSDGRIYAMQTGTRRYISNFEAFLACGYGLDAIFFLSNVLLSTVGEGAPVTGPPCPQPAFADGTLLYGSEGRVFVMQGGTRRWITSAEAFSACRYLWGNVNRIADSVLNRIPEGSSITGCTLTTVVLSGPLSLDNWGNCATNFQCAPMDIATPQPAHLDPSPTNSDRSQVIGIPSLALSTTSLTLAAASGTPSGAASVTISNVGTGPLVWRLSSSVPWLRSSRVQGVALGNDVGSQPYTVNIYADASGLPPGTYNGQIVVESPYVAGAPASIAVTLQVSGSAEGSLVYGSDGKVYVIRGGLKRYIPNPATFAVNGFSWANAFLVPDSWLAALPSGDPLLDVLADGNLPYGPDGRVFAMQANTKRWITSAETFQACGYGWDAIFPLSSTVLSTIGDGAPLSEPPCPYPSFSDRTLIYGSEGRVFAMQGGSKRWIVSAETFSACGYQWGNINRIADSTLNRIPEGPPIAGPPCP